MIPGEVIAESEPITINAGLEPIHQEVLNSGDRPIQVGSHFHFLEVNAALQFDRESARNRRLDIPSGTAVRFEPGQTKRIALIEFSAAGKHSRSSHSDMGGAE